MENTFDIETLATISSSKKERVDGEPSISNRLGVYFVAIASSEKPVAARRIACLRGVILLTHPFYFAKESGS